ncbi:MAG: hypothetical protein HKN43_05790 [Rhodothermales bacterium]|nr:hypothetical protein [Rhodothermales bacterium]
MIYQKSIPGALVSLFLIFSLTACDSSSNESTDLAVSGKVTDGDGYGKSLQAPIDGAIVTAATVGANGSLNALEGTTTTDVNGSYSLDLDTSADVFVTMAETSSYSGSALVARADGSSSVQASPINTETTGEVSVYQEMRASGEAGSFVDVIAFVDKVVAADIAAEAGMAATFASAIAAGNEGEDEYMERDNIDRRDEKEDDREEREHAALVALQSSLSAAASSSAEATALEAFEEALIDASIEAGFSAQSEARARQASQSSVKNLVASGNLSAETEFSLNKRLAVMTALAVSKAVEASFEAAGASASRLAAIATAGEAWVSGTRSASVESEINSQHASYAASIDVELAAEINVASATIDAAKAATNTAKVALNASLAIAADAAAIADAHIAFYLAAEVAVSTALSSSSNATLGTDVIALLAI